MIDAAALAVNNVVWELEDMECPDCGRASVRVFVKIVSSDARFLVVTTENEQDALAFITTLKKAGITNANVKKKFSD
jgi:hypothetical protein